jgi:hypothetical protein
MDLSASTLGVVYPEILTPAPMLTPFCRYVGYLRAGRTSVQPLNELLQLLPFALGFDFDTPIEQVPYSSVQTEPCRLLKDEPPVEYALH